MQCNSTGCFCSDPPVRVVMSTGEKYTMEEIEPGLYRYKYLPKTAEEVKALWAYTYDAKA